MIYSIVNNTISIHNDDSYNIFAETNPSTQAFFASEKEALDWGKSFVKSMIKAELLDVKMKISDTKDKELLNPKLKEDFYLSLTTNNEFEGELKASLVKENGTKEDIIFTFKDGISKILLNLSAGKYNLKFNEDIELDDKRYLIMHKEDEFGISVLYK